MRNLLMESVLNGKKVLHGELSAIVVRGGDGSG